MPYGLSSEEIEMLREAYRMFREGDPAFLDFFTPDARFVFATPLPGQATFDNTFEAVEFFTSIGEHFDSPYPYPEEFLRVEDRVVVIGTWRGRSRHSGEEISARFAHILRTADVEGSLTDQKIVAVETIADTAALLRGLDPSQPPSG